MNMDWASNEWKQSLSSVALQKVNTLEETVARLQKERQQKQLQCECLELALDKEKRKVDEGKQQYVQLERQLQSLADTNKSFENKTSKLQNEIQSRDLRINSLEGLLSQAKKENSRLQQLGKDIEELQCLKESAQQEVKKLKQEQNVGKKDCVISELEQQIKDLQKSQNRETSLMDISDVKENIKNIINTSCTQDYQSFELDSLKEKVSEQETIIKELRKKLNTQDRALSESVPSTPGRVRGSFVDSPPKSAKKSAWNSCGSTPMKEYRGFRHHSDSSTFSSTEEEKIQFLQLRVKQLCQELECQRHNSEASKNSLEQKMKEKENALKAEIKHQAQVIADLDKELKEIRNKYQQDISQASKKLDLTTLQLSKAEQVKVQLEADKKSLDMKINAYEFSLKQKEEELEEIQKAKFSCEAKMQALISENSELEKSCKVLQDKNNSLTEEMKTLQLQLEGSNNLVKEKENAYHNIKKELEILSKSHGLLEAKAQQQEDKVAVTKAENVHLEAKICDYSLKEGILNEKIEILEKEKKEILTKIAVESNNVQILESKITALTLTLNEVEGNLSSKVADFENLSKEMLNSRDSYEKKVRELEDAIAAAVAENKALEAKIEDYSSSEVMLKEKIELLERDKKEMLNEAAVKTGKVLALESNIKELNTTLNKAQEDLSFKAEELEYLSQEMANLKDIYQAKAHELEDAVAATKAENDNLKEKVADYSLNEGILKEKNEILKKEKKEFLMKIAIEFDNKQALESKIEELTLTLKKHEDDLSSKVADFEKLSKEMLNTKDSYENKVGELQDAVAAAVAENKTLEAKIEEYSTSEAMLKEKIELLEKEKEKVLNDAAAEGGKVLTLESNIKELNNALNKAQEDLSLTAEELEHRNQEISNLRKIYENKVGELEDEIAAAVVENKTLEAKMEEYYLCEAILKEKIEVLEKEKKEAVNEAAAEAGNVLTLKANIKELNTALNKAREDLSIKAEESEHLSQEMTNLKDTYYNKVRELEDVVAAAVAESKTLEAKIQEYTLNETILKEKIALLEKEKEEVLNEAAVGGGKVLTLESNIRELNIALNDAQEVLSSKSEQLEHLSREISNLKQMHENKVRELEDVVAAAVGESKTLEDKIEEYSLNEAMLKEKIELLEKEKEEILNDSATVGGKVLFLESNIEELNTALNEAQEVLSLNIEKLEHLSQEISHLKELHENKIRQLEDVVAATVGESKTLEAKIEEYSLNEAMLKEKIELLEKEKEEVLNEAVVEGDKVLTLEYNIKELNTALNEAREVLSLKTEELEHLSQEIANLKEMHENKVRELEDVVAAAVGESKTLEDKIEEYSLNEATLKEKIELLEKEKEEVLNQVAVEGGKVLTLQSNIKELNTALNEAGEILSLKTEELEHLRQEISNLKEMHKNEIKQLQSDTTEVKLKINFLETCIKMVETSKRTLEEELKQLQIEEERLLNSITSETEKTFIQNKRLEELTSSVEDLQIQLSLKTEEYDELKRELINAKSFTESMMSELEEAKSIISHLENQVKELSNKSLNEKFLFEKMEKDRINEELTFQTENTDLLDSVLQEQEISAQRLQAIFLQKEEECKQLSSELANLQVLYEEKIHEHEDQLSSSKSEKDLLENQLTACLTKQNLLREKLESFAIAKSIVHELLSTETGKVQMLAVGLGEIKADLINLQSVLSQSDAHYVNYSSKKGDQKDSLKNSLCKICLSKNREPEIISGIQQKINSIEFGSLIREALMFQNLKEKVCFSELNESTFNTFTHLCSLEKNLVDKLTKCEFLVCRKLLDDKSLFDVCLTAFNLRKHLHTIANLRNVSYYILQKTNRDSLRVDIYLNEILNLFSNILCKSKPFDNNMQMERQVNETSVELQENLKSIMLFISKYIHKTLKNIKLYTLYLDRFENIHCNISHFPVIKNTNYVLCVNKVNNTYIRHEILNSERSFGMQKDLNLVNFNLNLNFKEIISIVSASYCSVLLNFAVCVFEEGMSKIPSDNLSNISSNYRYSLLSHQELSNLCLLIHSYSNGGPIQSCINNIMNSEKSDIIDMYSKLCCRNMKFNECNFGTIIYDKNEFDLSELFFKDVKEIIYEIEKLKREIARAQKRIDTLQHCYEVEKIKNINLSTVIEEVENKLSRVYLEKEKLKVKFLDAKKLFTHVQNLINIKSGLSAMEIDIDSFSESCFCEICETGSDGTCSLDEYQHDILKPINLLKSLVEFIATHNNLKTEIEQIQRDMSDFQAENADLHSKIAELKTELKGMAELKTKIKQMRTDESDFQAENTIVQSTDVELKTDLESVKEKETVILNSECDRLTKISENMSSLNCKKDCLILNLEETETELDNSVISKSEKLIEHGKALHGVHAENSKTNLCPNYKEEILIFQNSIQEKEKALEQMSLKCENYEKEINDLNAKLYRFEVDKEVLQTSEQQSKKIISELQKKVKSLEQSKISLNLTIENVEEELQSIYSEKQELQNKLDELAAQTNNSSKTKDLEHDILFWKDKYEEEKKSVDILSRNLEELEKMKQDNEIYCEELKNRNKILETDVMILKNIKFEHECALLEKISNSEHNLITITQLKQKISDIKTEKLELESKIKEVEVNLYCKQETEIALHNEIQNVKNELQNIKIEKLRETANYKKEICRLEKEREQIKICIEELSEECNTLKLKLKDMIEDKKEDGKIIEELKKKICSEGINMQNELQEALEKQYAKEKIALKKLNQELEEAHADVKQIKAINCELNSEISLLKANQTSQTESYKKKYDDLFTKFIHQQDENQNLKLKISSNANTFNNNLSSELQNAKTALTTAKNFIVKILNLIINMVESYSLHEEYETGKSDLISLKVAWEQSIEVLLKSEFKLQNDISTWLVSFFKAFNFSKEIQVMLQNISKSICNFASETEEHPETFIDNQMSCGEYINDISCDNKFTIVSSNIITELLCNLRLLQQTFCKFKKIIQENKKEMNHQKEMLEEMSLKFKATLSDEQKNKHGNPPEPKFNIIRLNYRRLEKKHENLLKTCEEMEQRIKGLEEEKQNLEDEMEEMVSKLKGSDSTTDDCSSELFNTLVVLGEVKKQNSNLERENKWLKSVLQEMQLSSKNHEDKDSSYSTCRGKMSSNSSETDKILTFKVPFTTE